jgi:hypothetical protein
MGQLRDRMEQDLKLKGVSPATIRNYLLYCRKFAAFFMRSPEELGAAEVRAFLLHQIEVEQLSYASYRQVYAALKFLYSVTLGRPGEVSRLRPTRSLCRGCVWVLLLIATHRGEPQMLSCRSCLQYIVPVFASSRRPTCMRCGCGWRIWWNSSILSWS